LQGGFALGEFDQETFAVHAAAAEAGEGLDEADKGLGMLLEGLGESGRVEPGEDLADAQGGDLLGGFVDFAVFIFVEQIKEELVLSLGVFAALLLGEPDKVAGFFPAGEIACVEGFAVIPELLEYLDIGDRGMRQRVRCQLRGC